MNKSYHYSVVEFAQPTPLTGHLRIGPQESSLMLGEEIHKRLQEIKEEEGGYEAEYSLQGSFRHEHTRFVVSGRVDGIVWGNPTHLEEIKTCASIGQLESELDKQPDHPYKLQLLTYCYLYERSHYKIPTASLLLVSQRSGEQKNYPLEYDKQAYEQWLEKRLRALWELQKERSQRRERRQELSKHLSFPFLSMREGQDELVHFIENETQRGSQTLLQAPTGYGKTMAILFPSLKEALSRGAQTIYVTPKNSQFSVVLDAVDALRRKHPQLHATFLSAQTKQCINDKKLECAPSHCEFSKGFYDKLNQTQPLKGRKVIEAGMLKQRGEMFGCCPYGLNLLALEQADLIVCDYNYVFSPQVHVLDGILDQKKNLRPNLIVDEAHNLFSRSNDYYTCSLSLAELEDIKLNVNGVGEKLKKKVFACVLDVQQWVLSFAQNKRGTEEIKIERKKLQKFRNQALDLLMQVISDESAEKNGVLKLFSLLENLYQSLDVAHSGFIQYVSSNYENTTVYLQCLDSSSFLEPRYKSFHHVTQFSATLKPFSFFQKINGLDESATAREFKSHFPVENRKILIIPQITTKFRERQRSAPKIRDVIQRVSQIEPGHYLCFFPSYQFMNQVIEAFGTDPSIWAQSPQMTNEEVSEALESTYEKGEKLFFGVQGGVLSEGVDYQSRYLKGAFIVGPGLPAFDLPREKLKAFFEKKYGDGFAFAYSYPAMIRSIQAAGRVIRSEKKRGLLVFMDSRFVHPSYAELMPHGWYQDSVNELVSGSILKDVEQFWSSSP